jgi:hypothetical protein
VAKSCRAQPLPESSGRFCHPFHEKEEDRKMDDRKMRRDIPFQSNMFLSLIFLSHFLRIIDLYRSAASLIAPK